MTDNDFDADTTPTDCDLHLMEIMGEPLAQMVNAEMGDDSVLLSLLKLAYYRGAQTGIDKMTEAIKQFAKP